MTKLYIFDRGAGFLQHVSDHLDKMEALKDFAATVGIGDDIDLEGWHFVEADEVLGKAIEEWADKGHPADECPIEPWAPRY